MRPYATASDLAQKLMSIGVLLGAINSSAELGPSTVPSASVSPWQISNASTFRLRLHGPTAAELELALVEVRTARAILAQSELRSEQAFRAYLETLASALMVYERGADGTGREVHLATALAVARTALQDDVANLSSWLAVMRSTGPESRFLAVPDRFVEPTPFALHHDEGLEDSTVLTWLDLDSARA